MGNFGCGAFKSIVEKNRNATPFELVKPHPMLDLNTKAELHGSFNGLLAARAFCL